MTLSILCVTKLEPHAGYFLGRMRDLAMDIGAEFAVAIDGDEPKTFSDADRIGFVHSKGYIESVLDRALELCTGSYVLRLDDDETVSPAMRKWLSDGTFLGADHWKFPRAHLWPDAESVLVTAQLWPDVQTRLSTREKSGGRHGVHAGSPFGGGEDAPVIIEHHKFLVRTYDQRLAIARRYDAYANGYGTGGMRAFSLPEDVYEDVLIVAKGDGRIDWQPSWRKELSMKGVS